MAERIVYLASTTFFCFVVSKISLRTILLHAGKLIQVFFVFYTVSPAVDAYSVRRQRTAKMAMLLLLTRARRRRVIVVSLCVCVCLSVCLCVTM